MDTTYNHQLSSYNMYDRVTCEGHLKTQYPATKSFKFIRTYSRKEETYLEIQKGSPFHMNCSCSCAIILTATSNPQSIIHLAIWANKTWKEMKVVTWNCVLSKLRQLQTSKELFPVFLMLSLTQKFSSPLFSNTVLVCDRFFSLHDTSLGWTHLTLNPWVHALNKLPNHCYFHEGNAG